MSRYYYQAAIRHDGLGKHRVIRGADRDLVEAAAYEPPLFFGLCVSSPSVLGIPFRPKAW